MTPPESERSRPSGRDSTETGTQFVMALPGSWRVLPIGPWAHRYTLDGSTAGVATAYGDAFRSHR